MAQTILLFLLLIAFLSGFFFLWKLPVIRPDQDKDFTPSISVIVPARDEEASLPKLLASLKEQSLGIKEIIVVDDESEDKTVEISEGYGATVLSTKESGNIRAGKPAACWLALSMQKVTIWHSWMPIHSVQGNRRLNISSPNS